MNIDKFEERIKSAFGRHRPEADTDAIWQNIEPHLKKKKKRRFILFFWLLGLALMFHFRHDGWERFAASASPTSNDKEAMVSSASKEGQGGGTTYSSGGKPGSTISGNAASSHSREDAAGKNTGSHARAEALAIGTNTTPKFTVSEGNVAQKEAAPNGIGVDSKDDKAAQVVTDEAQADVLPAVLEKEGLERDSIPKTLLTETPEQNASDAKTVESGEKKEKANKNAQSDKKKPDQRKKSKKRKSRWEHNLGILAGPVLAIKQLSDDGGVTAPTGLEEGRKSTEHSMESFTAGMFYSAATRKGLVLKTGLDYRQTNEKFQLEYYEKETEQINGVLTVTVDNAGNTIGQSMGLKTVTKTTEYSNTAYNHYRYLNLPVGLGYRHTAKKSRWELSGGVDFNLLFRADGTIYNSSIMPVHFEHGMTSYDNIFRDNTGMGLWASYAYDWKLTDNMRWQLSANAQMPLQPVSSPDYELTQRYFNFGVQVGLVYQITKLKKVK